MKKVIVLFLLGIFLFNTMGYFIAFKTIQYSIRSEIKEEIKQKFTPPQLITIVVDKQQLSKIEWSEEGEEMHYDSKLYDVVRFTETKKSITYYCINDTQEESLFAGLEEHIATHVSGNKPIKNESSKNIIDTTIKLYYSFISDFKFDTGCLSTPPIFTNNLIYTSALIETESIPPEFC